MPNSSITHDISQRRGFVLKSEYGKNRYPDVLQHVRKREMTRAPGFLLKAGMA